MLSANKKYLVILLLEGTDTVKMKCIKQIVKKNKIKIFIIKGEFTWKIRY